ncbi:MAG: sigma-70 family RNA polymerase sigma factor [Oscillospiraceae bacterium]|nr:sigma-70 family RNA polymerase sigma factor [Oscillospiraceae bacterium]
MSRLTDAHALHALRRGDADALARLFDKYGAYVATVVHGIIGARMAYEDVEEVISDVFVALWQHAEKVETAKLKAYLGSIARNRAKNKLRQCLDVLPLDDDLMAVGADSIEETVIGGEERRAVRLALAAMPQPDKGIFLRHYYGLQTVQAIADDMNMTASAVKQRLARGRKKLQAILEKEFDR